MVLEVLLDVLEVLLEVLDLSWRSWSCIVVGLPEEPVCEALSYGGPSVEVMYSASKRSLQRAFQGL